MMPSCIECGEDLKVATIQPEVTGVECYCPIQWISGQPVPQSWICQTAPTVSAEDLEGLIDNYEPPDNDPREGEICDFN